MSKKDYFKLALVEVLRSVKKVYIFIILICTILTLGLFIFNHNINKMVNIISTKEIGYRSLSVIPRFINGEYDLDKDVEDLARLNHVIDVFYGLEGINLESSFKNQDLDGTVYLLRANNKTLPPLKKGRIFNDNETNVAICPLKFYPDSEASNVISSNIIDGDEILDTTFSVTYHDYKLDKKFNSEINNTYTKEFKVIGLYDVSERINESNVCYIPIDDMLEIGSKETISNGVGIPAITVIIDDIDNVNNVLEEAKKLNFTDISLRAFIDYNQVNIVKMSVIIIFIVMLLLVIAITNSYSKKKINENESIIGVMLSSGYSNKIIKKIYLLEMAIVNLFSYLIGVLLFLIIYFYVINKIPSLTGANIMLGGISVDFLSFFLSFIIIVILPCLFLNMYIDKKCKQNIITLINDGE